MDPDVARIAQIFTIIGVFGGGVVLLGLLVRVVLVRTGSKPLQRGAITSIDEARLARLEQAVDAIAVEVERIGESQRFSARLMSERLPERLPAPAQEPEGAAPPHRGSSPR
jgi:hypothetical protein